jgi:hypothetical protein
MGLGQFQDDPQLLEAAADYLDRGGAHRPAAAVQERPHTCCVIEYRFSHAA